jgi:8-oxo-dGTP diphosphatase
VGRNGDSEARSASADVTVTCAIVRRLDAVLLVMQSNGVLDFWLTPGGRTEPGELVVDALRREIQEETGLEIREIGPLVYVMQRRNAEGVRLTVLTFEASVGPGEPRPADPDGLIMDVAFVEVGRARELIERLPWAYVREPLLAYLNNRYAAGELWRYTVDGEGEEQVERVPAAN